MTETRALMVLSSLALVVTGAALSFLPQELLEFAGAAVSPSSVLPLQLLGAAYLGFALLDWTARGNLIGGIYSRPVAVANFAHFTIAAVTLAKAAHAADGNALLLAATGAHAILAAWFGKILFAPPVTRGEA